MPFETLLSLDNEEYNKSMNLMFDINENLFNDIFYLYNKAVEYGIINNNRNNYFKQSHDINEIKRIFINDIFFSLLINKHTGFKYSQFKKSKSKIQNTEFDYFEKLFNLIKYDSIQFEKAQQIFPYKIILVRKKRKI